MKNPEIIVGKGLVPREHLEAFKRGLAGIISALSYTEPNVERVVVTDNLHTELAKNRQRLRGKHHFIMPETSEWKGFVVAEEQEGLLFQTLFLPFPIILLLWGPAKVDDAEMSATFMVYTKLLNDHVSRLLSEAFDVGSAYYGCRWYRAWKYKSGDPVLDLDAGAYMVWRTYFGARDQVFRYSKRNELRNAAWLIYQQNEVEMLDDIGDYLDNAPSSETLHSHYLLKVKEMLYYNALFTGYVDETQRGEIAKLKLCHWMERNTIIGPIWKQMREVLGDMYDAPELGGTEALMENLKKAILTFHNLFGFTLITQANGERDVVYSFTEYHWIDVDEDDAEISDCFE